MTMRWDLPRVPAQGIRDEKSLVLCFTILAFALGILMDEALIVT